MAKIPTYLLNLAGEYRVCSELNKRGVFATITYGNHKGVDVYAIGDLQQRAIKIEVKTSQQNKFVTSISQKNLANDPHAPQFWVLFQIRPGDESESGESTFRERFFILSHKEICKAQAKRNETYAVGYRSRHLKEPDFAKGVDNITVEDVTQFEDQWSKITKLVRTESK